MCSDLGDKGLGFNQVWLHMQFAIHYSYKIVEHVSRTRLLNLLAKPPASYWIRPERNIKGWELPLANPQPRPPLINMIKTGYSFRGFGGNFPSLERLHARFSRRGGGEITRMSRLYRPNYICIITQYIVQHKILF